MKNKNRNEIRTYSAPTPDVHESSGSAGQSGNTQGLSDIAEADSESVQELVEEGQSFEAEVIMGLENVPDADVSEVRTKQVRPDDVTQEEGEEE